MADRPSVVLVEVDPQLAVVLELYLSAREFAVTSVSSAAAALRLVAADPPQAVVIGHAPGQVDAGELALRVRAMAAHRPPVIVALAGPLVVELVGIDAVVPRREHPRLVAEAIRAGARRLLTSDLVAARAGGVSSSLPVE